MSTEIFPYGGQAVHEGVMMRGQHQVTVAVRKPNGQIVLRHERLNPSQRQFWELWPGIRGICILWDTLHLGIRAMNFATEVAAGRQATTLSHSNTRTLVVTTLSLLITLFFVLPLIIGEVVGWIVSLGDPMIYLVVREASDGIARLVMLGIYIITIGQAPSVQRVFGYHGAEHKTINAYEAGAPLTIANVRRFPLIHPRCGTSFLFVVILLSIILFAELWWMPLWARFLSRVVMLPLIAALAYELMKLSATHMRRPWVQALTTPLMALQRLTTREPDDRMVEVAIAALHPVLEADGRAAITHYDQPIGVSPNVA